MKLTPERREQIKRLAEDDLYSNHSIARELLSALEAAEAEAKDARSQAFLTVASYKDKLKVAFRERDEALGRLEFVSREWETCLQMRDEARAQVERLTAALERIERWFGEFPPSERFWEDGNPMSYGAAFGSNRERDFMRSVTREALATLPADALARRQAMERVVDVALKLDANQKPSPSRYLLNVELHKAVTALRALDAAGEEEAVS